MAWAYAAGVITQTGTNTDLTGLTGLTGVTTTTGGAKTMYLISSARIYVQGTLSWNPDTECIVFDNNATYPHLYCDGVGQITIGTRQTTGSYTYPQFGSNIAILALEKSSSAISGTANGIEIAFSGKLIHNSGCIDMAASCVVQSTASTCEFYSDIILRDTTVQRARFRLYGANLATFGTTARIFGNGIECAYSTGSGGISNVTIIQPTVFGLHSTAGSTSLASPAVFTAVNIIPGTASTLYPYNNTTWAAYDFLSGGNTTFNAGGMTTTRYTLVRIYATLNVTLTISGVAKSGVKVFAKDVNNGTRASYTCVTGAGLETYDETPDITYNVTTNGSGLSQMVVLLVNKRKTDTGGVIEDWRTTAIGTNVLNFYMKAYDTKPNTTAPDLSAQGAKSITVPIETDSSPTLSYAAAGALASISTLDDLYDASKYWAVQDANLYYPSGTTLPITAGGANLDLGNRNLVIDSGAAAAFAINTGTNTITIKCTTLLAGTKFSTITTTGTISYAGSGATNITYTDSTGVRPIIALTGLTANSRVQLYDTTSSTEIYNAVVAATSLNFRATWTTNHTIRYRIAYVSGVTAKTFVEGTGTLTSTGMPVTVVQTADATYNSNAIDGSTVTGITITPSPARVKINIAGGTVSWKSIYAYQCYWLSGAVGIADEAAFITAPDTANYILTGFSIRNDSATALTLTAGWGKDSVTNTIAGCIDVAGSIGNIYAEPDHIIPGSDLSAIQRNTNLIPALL
jgi:hypothetical protein